MIIAIGLFLGGTGSSPVLDWAVLFWALSGSASMVQVVHFFEHVENIYLAKNQVDWIPYEIIS